MPRKKYTKEDLCCNFLARMGPPNDRGCREWLAAKDADGYGVTHEPGKMRRATHVSLEIHDGNPVLPGTVVRHSCDNPPCVEPTHLKRATTQENVADRVAKGRTARGEKN